MTIWQSDVMYVYGRLGVVVGGRIFKLVGKLCYDRSTVLSKVAALCLRTLFIDASTV